MDSHDGSARKATLAARRQTIDPISSTENMFSSGSPSRFIRPAPIERVGNAHSPRTSEGSSAATSPTKQSSHSRSASLADVARQGKRLSLNFPVQTSAGGFSPRPSPTLTPTISTPSPSTASPTRGNFLTALAAQERRVMELKEELARAEQHLVILKKQWASHEAVKKRGDVKRVQQLQPLNTCMANLNLYHGSGGYSGDDDDTDGSSAWLHREMERRKALLNGSRTPQRKVFCGSRHTRALSLLSPEKGSYAPSFPQPADARSAREPPRGWRSDEKTGHAPRSSTTPNLRSTSSPTRQSFEIETVSPGKAIPSEKVIQTGRKMATDLKDNLWTFIEDLKQATVGDDGPKSRSIAVPNVDGTQERHPSIESQHSKAARSSKPGSGVSRASTVHGSRPTLRSRSSARTGTAHVDISGSFWKEHGISTTPHKQGGQGSAPTPTLRRTVEDDESWDMWDTPMADAKTVNRQHVAEKVDESSETDEHGRSESEVSGESSPRTSTSSTNPPLGLGMPRTVTSRDLASTPSKLSDPRGKVDRDAIPWPAIVRELSPCNLKRTASHLMNEWEKSLGLPPTPPLTAGPEVVGEAGGRNREE